MNTLQEFIANGFCEVVAENMISNYAARIGKEYGCWKLEDVNYDFDRKSQIWTMRCVQCGEAKQIKRPKMRDISLSCKCQKIKKIKKESLKVLHNGDFSYMNKVYGNDKVVGFKKTRKGSYEWICECQLCGNTHIRIPVELKEGRAPLCKCLTTRKDFGYLIGIQKNYLKVINVHQKAGDKSYLVCECCCGKIVNVNKYDWEHEIVKSCGCMHDKLLTTHGLSGKRLYRIWRGMNQRCYNPKSNAFYNYGGRGIAICDEWHGETGLKNFVAWAESHGYADNLSIDRIDVNGNYEPSNCRWADSDTQIENRRPSSEWKKREKGNKHKRRVLWTIDGIEKSAREWCEEYGMSYESVMYRIKANGMTVYEALTTPKVMDGRPRKVAAN